LSLFKPDPVWGPALFLLGRCAMDDSLPSILCVDDDVDVLELLKEYFTEQGFVVLTATNGVEAFLQVKRWQPKAVILDLFMPRLGGIGALGRIKALNPDVVVILVSGMGNALELVTEAGLSVAGAFTKPLNLTQLSETLARSGVVAPAALVAAATSGEAAQIKRPVRARVLVVDDELEFRKVLAEYLEDRGFDVIEAQDGEEALLRVPDFHPHIVLMDVMMAGMGGVEALRRIKTAAPETCVIMVTAVEDIDSARGALALGASDYVTKPFSFQYLDSVLEVHMLMDHIDPKSS
jgi:CheY-like chemotaxis protein